jgi:hypothetical protein
MVKIKISDNIIFMNNLTESISHEIIIYLNDLMLESNARFHETQTFRITAYGMEFELDRVEGSYEGSLPLLVSKMMFKKGFYEDVLSSMIESNDAVVKVMAMINEVQNKDPNGIFGFDMDLIDDGFEFDPPVKFEDVEDELNTINFNVCRYVGKALRKYQFFDPEGFKNMGYLNDDFK